MLTNVNVQEAVESHCFFPNLTKPNIQKAEQNLKKLEIQEAIQNLHKS